MFTKIFLLSIVFYVLYKYWMIYFNTVYNFLRDSFVVLYCNWFVFVSTFIVLKRRRSIFVGDLRGNS